jgi:predicted NBD/HSP70 family sugar kinase
MRETGINMEKVKVNNLASILKLLNRQGAMPRKDIADALNLTPAAVTLLCNEMISNNIMMDKGELVEEKRTGRKKILVDINYTNQYILALSIQPENTYVYISDLKANPIDKVSVKTDSEIEPEEFLRIIAKKGVELIKKLGLTKKDMLGVGVVITGIVDSQLGISKHAYGIWSTKVYIKEVLERQLGLTVTVANNVKAFAEAELLYESGKTNDDILFVKWGPGVGSAIVIQNKLYEGNDNMAAELGHYIVDPQGDKCRCGRTGCLEPLVSYSAIIKRIKKVFSKEVTPQLYELSSGNIAFLEEEILFNEHLEYISSTTDTAVIEILNDCIFTLAHTVVNTITILSPSQVIIFSLLLENETRWHYFIECCKNLNMDIDAELIKKSTLGNKINYIGPVAIVANQQFFDRGGLSN